MAELRGDGVHFGQPTYNQNGSETNDNTYQGRAAAVVKVGFGSCSTVNQSASGGSGSEGYVDGSSFEGKVVGGVLELARETRTPAIIITGGWDKSLTIPVPIYGLEQEVGREYAYANTQKSLALVTEKAISNWRKDR